MNIKPVQMERSHVSVKRKLEDVKKQLGFVPNLVSTLANSEAALDSYLAQSAALAKGELPGSLRERIALKVADFNGCDYCNTAHSHLAQRAGVPVNEILKSGRSADPKTDALIEFVQDLLDSKGNVGSQSLEKVRSAGYQDSEIVEAVANITHNVLTNFINNVANTDIDFPKFEGELKSAVNQ